MEIFLLTSAFFSAINHFVVVVTRPLPRNGGMVENHGAPKAGLLPRARTRGRRETESGQRVSGAVPFDGCTTFGKMNGFLLENCWRSNL